MAYDEAHALNNLGIAFQYQGRFAEARTRYLAAAQLFERAHERTSRVLPLQNVAALDYEAGNYADAIASYQGLLKQLDPQSDTSNYVAILNNLGTAQYAVGNTAGALNVLSHALSLTAGDAIPADRARTLHALGRTYLIVGDTERGAVFLEQALEMRRALGEGDRRGLLISLIRNGDLQRERGAIQEALKLHMQALDYALSPQEKTRVLLSAGLDHMASGDISAALAMYQRALELELPEDWPARVSVRGAHAYALMLKGDPEARTLLIKAAKAHESAGDDELAAQDYYLIASYDLRTGQYASALQSVEKSLSLVRVATASRDQPRSSGHLCRHPGGSVRTAGGDTDVAGGARAGWRDDGAVAILRAVCSRVAPRARTERFPRVRTIAGSRVATVPPSDTLLELDSRLAAKRHRLATVMDQQNPAAEYVASLRRDIALLRTELDVEQARQRQRSPDAPTPAGPFIACATATFDRTGFRRHDLAARRGAELDLVCDS